MEGFIVRHGEKFLTWNSVNRYQRSPGEAPLWTPNRDNAAVFKDEQEAREAIEEEYRNRAVVAA
jgi:hypothetical protein